MAASQEGRAEGPALLMVFDRGLVAERADALGRTVVQCPSCSEDTTPALTKAGISICGNCGASVIDEDPPRLARALDMEGIGDADLLALRRARAALARPTRRHR